jgi:hypothetical protein
MLKKLDAITDVLVNVLLIGNSGEFDVWFSFLTPHPCEKKAKTISRGKSFDFGMGVCTACWAKFMGIKRVILCFILLILSGRRKNNLVY